MCCHEWSSHVSLMMNDYKWLMMVGALAQIVVRPREKAAMIRLFSHITVNAHTAYMYMCTPVWKKEPTYFHLINETKEKYLYKCGFWIRRWMIHGLTITLEHGLTITLELLNMCIKNIQVHTVHGL